jgi:CubicO group peptidase (beta-lactamase class C family)
LIVGAIGAWLVQPWAAYSPLRMLIAREPGRLLETFRSFDEIVPHDEILARPDAARFERAEAPLDVAYDWNGESKLLETFIEEASVTGLLVLKDGVIEHERYRLGATEESRHATFGFAKGVVAALIGAAQNDGLIASLDDPAATYAPQFTATEIGSTSLRQLLASSSGLAGVETDAVLDADLDRLFLQTFVLGGDPDRIASRARRVRPPAEALDVASLDAQVLAAVVSAVYRAPLAQVVEEEIWRPFGMTASASWSKSRDDGRGVALGFCCWNATLQDIARFGELLRREGAGGEERLLPEGWLDAAAEPPGDYALPGASEAYAPWGYGQGFFLPDGEDGPLLLAGAYGQYLWIDRGAATVVVMTAADPDWRERRAEATAALRRIVEAAR